MGLTAEQQQELDDFLHNNPGDEGRASSALGFDTTGGNGGAGGGGSDSGGNGGSSRGPGTAPGSFDSDPSGYKEPGYDYIDGVGWVKQAGSGNDGGGGGTGGGPGHSGGPGDPVYDANPRDFMINRDKGSWEAYLKQQLGSLYDPTTLQSAVANVSYAQNAGRDPKQILDGIIAKEKLRLTDTPGSTYVPSPTAWGGGSLTKPVVPPPTPTTGPTTRTNAQPSLTSFNQFGSDGSGNLSSMNPWAPSPLEHLPQSQPIAPFTGTYSYPDFAAPTLDEARNAAGFQSMIQEAQKAIERSSAAKGTLLGPNNLRGLQDYTIGAADANYGNYFGQKLAGWQANRDNAANTFNTNKDTFNSNEANRFGSETTNQNTAFNQLNTNRNFDFTVNRDAFDRSQTGYQNSFSAYQYANDSYYKHLYDTAMLGRPSGA